MMRREIRCDIVVEQSSILMMMMIFNDTDYGEEGGEKDRSGSIIESRGKTHQPPPERTNERKGEVLWILFCILL